MGSQCRIQHSNWTRTATSLVIIFVFFFLTLYSSIFIQWKYLYFSWNNDFKREMCYKCENLDYSTFYFIINVFLVYICQEKAMATHSVLLPGKSHGLRSLVGWSPQGREESYTTEQLHIHFSLSCIGEGNGNSLQCLAWRIPGMGEPGRLPSMGSHRVGHNWSNLGAAAVYLPKCLY